MQLTARVNFLNQLNVDNHESLFYELDTSSLNYQNDLKQVHLNFQPNLIKKSYNQKELFIKDKYQDFFLSSNCFFQQIEFNTTSLVFHMQCQSLDIDKFSNFLFQFPITKSINFYLLENNKIKTSTYKKSFFSLPINHNPIFLPEHFFINGSVPHNVFYENDTLIIDFSSCFNCSANTFLMKGSIKNIENIFTYLCLTKSISTDEIEAFIPFILYNNTPDIFYTLTLLSHLHLCNISEYNLIGDLVNHSILRNDCNKIFSHKSVLKF